MLTEQRKIQKRERENRQKYVSGSISAFELNDGN